MGTPRIPSCRARPHALSITTPVHMASALAASAASAVQGRPLPAANRCVPAPPSPYPNLILGKMRFNPLSPDGDFPLPASWRRARRTPPKAADPPEPPPPSARDCDGVEMRPRDTSYYS